MGIAEVYRYIENIGRLRPGTLEELSFLSHSFWGGPITFNTQEVSPYQLGDANDNQRDPADRDARFWKDFNSTNMPNKAQFVAAFSATPLVKVWGCLAKQVWRDALNKARAATNDTQTLGVPANVRTFWSHPSTVFPDTRPGIHDVFKQSLYTANFQYQLAKVISKAGVGQRPGHRHAGAQDGFRAAGLRPRVRPFDPGRQDRQGGGHRETRAGLHEGQLRLDLR